jgi:hypothetical protein
MTTSGDIQGLIDINPCFKANKTTSALLWRLNASLMCQRWRDEGSTSFVATRSFAGRELCWNPDLECRPPDGRIYEFRCALHRRIMPPAQTCYGMYFNTDSLRFFVAFATVNTA